MLQSANTADVDGENLMSRLDRVVLSTNEDKTYYEFWPHVAKAWKHLFGVKVSLAVVTNKPESDPWVRDLKRYGDDVVLFPEVPQVPTPNLAQVVRHILASSYQDEVCMINDIDLLPLQVEWYLQRLEKRESGQVLALGAEFFEGGPDDGKFPMGYVTAEGSTWSEIVNPNNLQFVSLVRSWIGTKVVDHKEDISKTTWHEYKDAFADESLMRVWLNRWGHNDRIVHARWDFKPGIDSVDRSKWNVDTEKLKNGLYIESHLPRPYNKFKKQVDQLLQHVYSL